MAEQKVDKPCEACGVIMRDVDPQRRFCYKCTSKRRSANSTIWRQKQREQRKLEPVVTDVSDNDSIARYCRGCTYWGGGNESAACCNYIFMEGQRRPCPPGKGCTVKRLRKGRRQNE